jgi:uncharacterized protein (TIGR03435 family)
MGPHGVSLEISHERVNLNAATLRQIIGLAYSIQRVRVLGGPDWLDSEFYDIVAKAKSAYPSRDDFLAMLQMLLADRFKLAIHKEVKELTEYVLVVGKHGAKLKDASDDEKTGIAPSITPDGVRQISFSRMPLSGLVNLLANQIGSPVLDQTGLKGLYDFKIDWAITSTGIQPTDAGNPIQAAEPGMALFDTLNVQLGLTLQSKKGSAEVLIVDRAQRASEN